MELHRKQYPYPEEYVYSVIGGKVSAGQINFSSLTSLIVVAKTMETASNYLLSLARRAPGIITVSCVAMSDMRKLSSQIDRALEHPENIPRIPVDNVFGLSFSTRLPWLIGIQATEGAHVSRMVVLAHGVEDIEAWARKNNHILATVISQSMIEATVKEMQVVRDGQAEVEHYAMSQVDWDDIGKSIDNWSTEDSQASAARAIRKYLEAHPEEREAQQ